MTEDDGTQAFGELGEGTREIERADWDTQEWRDYVIAKYGDGGSAF